MVDLLGQTIKVGDILFRYGGGNRACAYGLVPVLVTEVLEDKGKIRVKSLTCRWGRQVMVGPKCWDPKCWEFTVNSGLITETTHCILWDYKPTDFRIVCLWESAVKGNDLSLTNDERADIALWLNNGKQK